MASHSISAPPMLHTPVSVPSSDPVPAQTQSINSSTGGNQFRPPTVNAAGKYSYYFAIQLITQPPLISSAVQEESLKVK